MGGWANGWMVGLDPESASRGVPRLVHCLEVLASWAAPPARDQQCQVRGADREVSARTRWRGLLPLVEQATTDGQRSSALRRSPGKTLSKGRLGLEGSQDEEEHRGSSVRLDQQPLPPASRPPSPTLLPGRPSTKGFGPFPRSTPKLLRFERPRNARGVEKGSPQLSRSAIRLRQQMSMLLDGMSSTTHSLART